MAGQIEYHKVLDACWHNDIYVRLKPINRGYKSGGYPVKINLEINGRIVKFGEMEWKQNSKELEEKIEEIYRSRYELMQ